MLNKQEKNLRLKFLEKFYPVTRVKCKGRFRRGVLFDDGTSFIIGDSKHYNVLKHKLLAVLTKVFGENSTNEIVLSIFLEMSQKGDNLLAKHL